MGGGGYRSSSGFSYNFMYEYNGHINRLRGRWPDMNLDTSLFASKATDIEVSQFSGQAAGNGGGRRLGSSGLRCLCIRRAQNLLFQRLLGWSGLEAQGIWWCKDATKETQQETCLALPGYFKGDSEWKAEEMSRYLLGEGWRGRLKQVDGSENDRLDTD